MMEVLGRKGGAVKQSGLEHCPNDRLCRTANTANRANLQPG